MPHRVYNAIVGIDCRLAVCQLINAIVFSCISQILLEGAGVGLVYNRQNDPTSPHDDASADTTASAELQDSNKLPVLRVFDHHRIDRCRNWRRDAAIYASRLRFRPIVMTSLGFILGVVPLMIGHGAGAEMRRALGTAVFSGMLGVTIFGVILTPTFYYVIRRVTGGETPAVGEAPPAAEPVAPSPPIDVTPGDAAPEASPPPEDGNGAADGPAPPPETNEATSSKSRKRRR